MSTAAAARKPMLRTLTTIVGFAAVTAAHVRLGRHGAVAFRKWQRARADDHHVVRRDGEERLSAWPCDVSPRCSSEKTTPRRAATK
jgi:hypothetical protein